jgi:uncharacterized protein YbjT (DUF2867 family)
MEKIVLVTGATGRQGGATTRHLLARGWRVRALVRDPGTAAARALAAAGAEPVTGDMADRASLDAAMAGTYGVFSVQPAATAPHGDADEVAMGRNVADAAQAAGIAHLVYASVGGAERGSGISHWNTKWEIEQHIRALGVPATVLRPVMFMSNHLSGRFGVRGDTALVRIVPPTSTVQLIAAEDIGAFAALAFADPAGYVGQALEIAGDELTRDDLVAALERAAGHRVTTDPLAPEVLAALGLDADNPKRATSFAGWQADIPALRRRHPDLMTVQTWLDRGAAAHFRALFT